MSVDILMYKGDLGLTKDRSGLYDLVLEEAGQSLLRRTVMTPPSWIRMWCIEANIISMVDGNYGDRIYLQLSDPLNKEWVALARANIQHSISYVKDEDLLEITNISVGVSSSNGSTPDTANVQIDYRYEGVSRVYQERIKV